MSRLSGFIKSIIKRANGEIPVKALIKRGLTVGENFIRQSGCFIDPSFCHLIEIGNNVTFSKNVMLLAHDASTAKLLDYTKIGKITIGDNTFIGANATVLPGNRIGSNVIIGAGSVVTKDIPDGMVAAGNPARILCTTREYKEKNEGLLKEGKVFSYDYTVGGGATKEKLEETKNYLSDNKYGFIK